MTAYNQPYNTPLQICIAGRMHFSKKKLSDMFFSNLNKEPEEEKNYRWTEFFLKLDNNGWKMHTGARVRKQKYISIYISLHMKTFLKTGAPVFLQVRSCAFPPPGGGGTWVNVCRVCAAGLSELLPHYSLFLGQL